MKRPINFDAQGTASRIEHDPIPKTETEDFHEIDAEDLEELAPWEDPVQHAQAAVHRQAHEEWTWQKREQRKVSEEIARLTRREGLSHEGRMAEMKKRQITELRSREVRLQEQIGATRWWQFGEKARLNGALQLTVERLNGLSETTPDQRRRQRQQFVKETVRQTAVHPFAMQEKNLRDRITIQDPMTPQERMYAASEERDSARTRFASIFRPSIRNKARAETLAASHAYAIEHRVNDATKQAESMETRKKDKAA